MLSIFKNTIEFVSKNSFVLFIFSLFCLLLLIHLFDGLVALSLSRSLTHYCSFSHLLLVSSTVFIITIIPLLVNLFFFWILKEKVVHTPGERELLHCTDTHSHTDCLLLFLFSYMEQQQQPSN